MDSVYRIKYAQTLKISFTEDEAFAAWHAITDAKVALDRELEAVNAVCFSHTHTQAERTAAFAKRDLIHARRTALIAARVAMSDGGL